MTVTAPPRRARLDDSLGRAEIELLIEALIEEARQRACRRRRRYLAAVVLLCAATIGALLLMGRTSGSASVAGRLPARPGAGRLHAGTIAVTQGSWSRTLLWSRGSLHDPGITGRAVAWSPDGRRLLVARSQVLYVVHSNGAGLVRLPRRGDAYNTVWSPDGTKIAFEGIPRTPAEQRSAFRRIYVVGSDGRNLRRLAGLATAMQDAWATGNLAWSPDGTHVLFAGRTEGDARRWLYLIRADGRGVPHPLVIRAHIVAPVQPSWSPDGSHLAFSVTRGPRPGVYSMTPNGAAMRRIAPGGHGPVWSPDSSVLAYRTNGYEFKIKGLRNYGGNWTVRANGTHRVALPPSTHAGFSWSPDSKLLAFVGPTGDILVIRRDGTHLARILAPILHNSARRYALPLWQHGTASVETG